MVWLTSPPEKYSWFYPAQNIGLCRRNGMHPNHYAMSTVWSDDSASLLAIYDSRYGIDQVYLLDVKMMQVKELIDELHSAFYKAARDKAASYYRKYGKEYSLGFLNPWFVGHDRFEITGSTFISKFDSSSIALASPYLRRIRQTGCYETLEQWVRRVGF